MSFTISKAILLAAGLGTRLRPLTLTTPKPLLPLDGCLLIDHQLHYLKKAGISDVVINLHHLGDQIKRHVGDGSRYGLRVDFSEEPAILGTGGGIKMAAPFFHGEPFVALNCDALIDADIAALGASHLSSGCAATMVLKGIEDGEGYTPVDVSVGGLVTGLNKGSHFFTGLHVLGPEVLDALPSAGVTSCIVRDGYMKLIERGGRIGSFIYSGYFNDLGTPERYDKAKKDVASGEFKLLI